MLMPPDAEPVTADRVVIETASLTRGLGTAWRLSRINRNPGSTAITAPNPYSEAVFRDASRAPEIAVFVCAANVRKTRRNARPMTVRTPATSAPSTAQMAITVSRGVTRGWGSDGRSTTMLAE